MSRVDTWETVASVAIHAGKPRTVRGTRSSLSAYSIALTLGRLARIAKTLHQLYERACDEDVPQCDVCAGAICEGRSLHTPTRCHYARVERLEARAVFLGRELGIVVTTQRDPRGAAVKMWADKEDGRMLGYFS